MEPSPPLNLNWVTPSLAVGGRFELTHCEHLAQELGIRRIVDVRIETCDDAEVLRRHGIELLHLPTVDRCAVSQRLLDQGVAWVTEQLARGHKVYIHCEHGVGRSALLALCVLVRMGERPLEALKRAKEARWRVSPSPEQLEGFTAWCRRQGLSDDAVPTFEELAYVAYAHLREPSGSTNGTATAG